MKESVMTRRRQVQTLRHRLGLAGAVAALIASTVATPVSATSHPGTLDTTFDTTFDTDGKQVTPNGAFYGGASASDVAVQLDGKSSSSARAGMSSPWLALTRPASSILRSTVTGS